MFAHDVQLKNVKTHALSSVLNFLISHETQTSSLTFLHMGCIFISFLLLLQAYSLRKYLSCTLQITLEDGLPQQICLPCAKKASELYLFKKQCETSDQLLREMLGKPPLCKVLLDEIKRTKSLEFTEDVIVKSENNADLCESSNDFDASVETIQPDETKSGMPRKLKLKKQKHECNVCRKIFKHVSFLKRHMKVHDPPENLLCDVCNKTFTRSDLLQRHKTIHGLQTQLADTKLHNGASVGVNISELPPAEEKLSELKCSACNVYFNKWKLYVQHIESGHPDLGYSCMMCYRKFQKKSHLKRHMVTHQIVKPHSCDLCDKGFSRLEQLVRHKNDHSGIKTHICHICSRGKSEKRYSISNKLPFLSWRLIILYRYVQRFSTNFKLKRSHEDTQRGETVPVFDLR